MSFRRNIWAFAALGCLLAVAASTALARAGTGPGKHFGESIRLFSPHSVWNQPLSDHATLDPSSKRRSRAFIAEIHREKRAKRGPWINTTSDSTPLYVVPRGQNRVPVKLDGAASGTSLQRAFDQGVPIPAGARPALGSDGHLTIYQPSTDKLWELWRGYTLLGHWHAAWGGAMDHVSRSPGYFNVHSWPSLIAPSGWNWGATATSLPAIAGTIRMAELRRGKIRHALALAIPSPCAWVFSWPAQRGDGDSRHQRTCLPEGAHLRIDPKLDLAKLHLPKPALVIARAAQRYGMIVRDKTHDATGFYAEAPKDPKVDPYTGPHGLFGGLDPWEFLPRIPWGHVELLKMHRCTHAPCELPH
jgi:hypothetical protein